MASWPTDDGPRLEFVQKGSPKSVRKRGKKRTHMATLRRQQTRPASTRQDRGSCSSTASCPVFSGPYSDHEEDPPLRRQSSPLLKGSLSSLNSSANLSPKGSFCSLQGSVPCIQGSLSSLHGSLSNFQNSLPNLRGSLSRMKRRSLGSLDNSMPNPIEQSKSPSLQSGNGSSSDDDGSWDTNSWSSVATCLLRTPIKQDSNGQSFTTDQIASAAKAEDEIIYQNLIISRPLFKAESNRDHDPEKSCTVQRKDTGTQSMSSSCKNASSVFSHQHDEKSEDRRKFSQFLNEVTCRVLKSNGGPLQPPSILRHCNPTPPPPPPSTPSHTPLHSASTNPPPPSTLATNLWYSPTSSNLQTIKEYDSKDITSSVHQWSKILPSCRILEPREVLRKAKEESQSYPEHSPELCTKIQAQPTTGRLYLETDIDRVRRLDELVANGNLGKERNEKVLEKGIGRETKRENRTLWERNGGLGMEKEVVREKGKETHWERDRRGEKGKAKDKRREKPSWEKDRWTERGREKEKKLVRTSYEPSYAQMMARGRNNPCPVFSWPEQFPRMSYRSTSLPRPLNITESDGEMQHDTSSFHDHKDDLRKRLSYTTHKLEMVETEFDSTRQYLETELRRAQEELEKFTEKLRRIQSSYAALQRINQDLEDKMHRASQHHEEEKRALSREIIVLNNHLMEAKITINKLREDNDLYRKDCNLAAQLLQCSKSHYRAHKMSELPLDFQERISSHIEKHNQGSGVTMAMCHSNYPDAVPTAIIAKVLEKPEPGSCPVTRSPSPQTQDGDFLTGTGSTDHLNRRLSYKTSDLYCSDTALYCPERWQDTERRQSIDLHGTGLLQLHAQNSIDSNPDEDAFHSGSFSHHEPPSSFHHHDEFGTGSLPVSSSYSSFSLASDEKGGVSGGCGRTGSSTLSSSHQGLYMDWREGGSRDYERKSISSYDKDKSSFPKSHSIQHMVTPRSPQKDTSPAYTRTASCFSEPYHSSAPRLASSHSMGSTTGLGQARGGALDSQGDVQISEDDLSSRWRQLSVEDINTFSSSYRNITGRGSPYSFSERHFAMGPSSKVKGPLYSSFQEGDDVFHSRVMEQRFAMSSSSPSHSPQRKEHRKQEKTSVLYRAKDDSQDSECSLFLSGSSKDKESSGGATAAKKDYMNLSADSSAESLHQSSLEASSLQHYPSPRPSVRPRPSSSSALSVGPTLPKKTSPRYQKFGSTGLTRKDSLTKAQLYGTLLN